MLATTPAILTEYQEQPLKLLCSVNLVIFIISLIERFHFYTLVPAKSSSFSEVFFRFTLLSPVQIFGDQVVLSNCIQSLSILVSATKNSV